MSDYGVEIRTTDPGARAVPPGSLVVAHHRTPRAEITVERFTGGHLLHLAVAGCLFNDILRLAAERGITVTGLRVTADGDFVGEPTVSTGISYAVDISGSGSEVVLHRLVADAERDASIPLTLSRSTPVSASTISVHPVA
ncbi:MAG: OsmC family protein [Thermocrispum sp.]